MDETRAEHFKTWINSWVISRALPGAMVGIYDDEGQELFQHDSDNLTEGPARFSRDALFRIYSMTKPITAVAIMILVERGLLSVHDEVSKFIPSFANLTVCVGGTVDAPETEPAKTPMRVIHLLTHTSGITYGFFGTNISDMTLRKKLDPDWQNWYHYTELPVLCDAIATTPLCFHPGTKYHYGLSTDVLGRIIEVASGQTLGAFLQDHIFQPLGMDDTTFHVPPEKAHRLVDVFEIAPGHTFKHSTNPERDRLQPPVLEAAGGGLVSSLADYSKFTTMLVRGGTGANGAQVLSASSVDEMSSNHMPESADLADVSFEKGFSESVGPGFGFGYNVSILKRPDLARGAQLSPVGEFGWGGVGGTFFLIDREQRRSYVFFTTLVGAAIAYPIRPSFRHLCHWVFGDGETPKET